MPSSARACPGSRSCPSARHEVGAAQLRPGALRGQREPAGATLELQRRRRRQLRLGGLDHGGTAQAPGRLLPGQGEPEQGSVPRLDAGLQRARAEIRRLDAPDREGSRGAGLHAQRVGGVAPRHSLIQRGAGQGQVARREAGSGRREIERAVRGLGAALGGQHELRLVEAAALPGRIGDRAVDPQKAPGEIDVERGLALDLAQIAECRLPGHDRDAAAERGPGRAPAPRRAEARPRSCRPRTGHRAARRRSRPRRSALRRSIEARPRTAPEACRGRCRGLEPRIPQHRLVDIGDRHARPAARVRGLDAGEPQAAVAPGGAQRQPLDLDPPEPPVQQVRQPPGDANPPNLLIGAAHRDAVDLETLPVEAQPARSGRPRGPRGAVRRAPRAPPAREAPRPGPRAGREWRRR